MEDNTLKWMGGEYSDVIICPKCKGEGSIDESKYYDDRQLRYTCKACKGDGRLIKITKTSYVRTYDYWKDVIE